MLARHLLANRRQEAGETLDHYVFALLQLSQNCGFRAVSARDHCEEAIRDAFIHGLRAAPVRQRLLETAQPSLAAAAARARVLTLLHQQAETYGAPAMPPDAVAAAPMNADAAASAPGPPRDAHDIADGDRAEEPSIMLLDAATAAPTDADAAVCTPGPPRSVPGIADGGETEGPDTPATTRAATTRVGTCFSAVLCSLRKMTAEGPGNQARVTLTDRVNGHRANALIETGRPDSSVPNAYAKARERLIHSAEGTVRLAPTLLQTSARGNSVMELEEKGHTYRSVEPLVIRNLCADVTLRHLVPGRHVSVAMPVGPGQVASDPECAGYGGSRAPPRIANRPESQPLAKQTRRNSTAARSNTAIDAGKRSCQLKRTSFADGKQYGLYTAPIAGKRSRQVKRTSFADSLCTAPDAVNRCSSYTAPDADKRRLQVKRTTFADGLYTAPIASKRLQPRKLIPSDATHGETCSQRATDDIIADDELSVAFAHADSILVCGGDPGSRQIPHRR